jgi:hypothetical protein
MNKESPSDGGGVKGAAFSTEKRDISLAGSYLVMQVYPKFMVHHRVINI